MKQKIIALSLLTLVSCAKEKGASEPTFHLDPQMTSKEYQQQLLLDTTPAPTIEIGNALTMGDRLMKWMNKVNQSRKETGAATVALTSKEQYQSSGGIPIEKPSVMSAELLRTKMAELLKTMPQAMQDVLSGSDDLPVDFVGMDDATFIKNAKTMNSLYQTAARLKLLTPYMAWYTKAQYRDVRGYWYLEKEKITADTLRDMTTIDAAKIDDVRLALVRICLNSQTSLAKCKSGLKESESSADVASYYEKYIDGAKAMWTGFFDMPASGVRKDLSWVDNHLNVPFNQTGERIQNYLKVNIEDEFKFGDWKLLLNFGNFPGSAELKYETGVTPHVNGVGGNIITMDENESIEEWSSQWTIRHEFGHVLGFPDCYHEFFDEEKGVFVNYQLDVKDLMCSRAGRMNERIFKQLEKNYKN